MKTKKQIERMLNALLKDERIHYPPAQLQINGPLALIQVGLEGKIRTLEWVLGVKKPAKLMEDK